MDKKSKFSELLRRQQESGLTVKDFCANECIPTSTFYYWRKKLRGINGENGFIPLTIKSPGTALNRRQSRSEQAMPYRESEDDPVLFELVYPNGTQMRIRQDLDLAHLRALIRLYD
jgi:hypothetical protein